MKKYNVDFLVQRPYDVIASPECVTVEAEDVKAAKVAAEKDLRDTLKREGQKLSDCTIQYIGCKEIEPAA